jgi:AcrR family transcriptional regulator
LRFFAQRAIFSAKLETVTAVDLSPPSHRERKKLATRRAIHVAALELVERHGLAGATIEAIAEQAGVAPRTFWSYFSSKEEAVLDHDPERPERLRLALLARPEEEDALTSLQKVLEGDLTARVTDRAQALRIGDLVRHEPELRAAVSATFEKVEQALVSAIAERTGQNPERDLYPGLIVSATCVACKVALLKWTGLPGRPGLQTLLEEAFEQLAAGLSAPLGKGSRR